MITHAEQIQAWAEFSSSRGFSVISNKRDYPPLDLWDDCRHVLIGVVESSFVHKHFPDDLKAELVMLAQLNKKLNDIAASSHYVTFCRVL